MIQIAILFLTFGLASSFSSSKWFDTVNTELLDFNHKASIITWHGYTGTPSPIPDKPIDIINSRAAWRQKRCSESRYIRTSTTNERRMIYLLCRGPLYTPTQLKVVTDMMGSLGAIYDTTVVRNDVGKSMKIEPDLQVLMRTSRDPELLLWAWRSWRDAIGPPCLQIYPAFIALQNEAARENGYHDIGECWREELEMPGLEDTVEMLFNDIAPLHRLLHGYVRYKLSKFYGSRRVSLEQPLPAHLLGNMWSHSWDSLSDLLLPNSIDFKSGLEKLVTSPKQMVLQAEQFYKSMGFPEMTEKFWQGSVIPGENDTLPLSCHGTSANMYSPDDFRMLVCARIDWEDFYVVTHEMGHIQYFTAYQHLPALFQDGANSAFQESIGDTMMMAVEQPENLKRLGIISNVTEDVRLALLLRQALKKIPHIPYSLALEKWRWEVMSGEIGPGEYNERWWDLRLKYEGIVPPVPRTSEDFDVISKFHIGDNTPYIRYFLMEFLQFQFLDVLCLEANQTLSNCDLYGSKEAGAKFKSMLAEGQKRTWNETLRMFSNGMYTRVTAEPLLRYFDPLMEWLKKEVVENDIPVKW